MKKELYDIKDCQSATQTNPPIEDTEEKTCKINFLQFVIKILLVEDGSVDTEKLDLLGIDYIVYRQGSKPPYFIEIGE